MRTRISYVCLSHPGFLRPGNQDNFFCAGEILPQENAGTEAPIRGHVFSGEKPLFGVFDGLGGEQQGETAAFLAAREAGTLKPGLRPQAALKSYCRRANQRICNYGSAHSLKATGTTAALALFSGGKVHLCNLGDSRIFRLRNRELSQLSQDHLFPWAREGKPPLTQYLGMPPWETVLEPHILTEHIRPEDRYLLCSDGLTDMLTQEQLRAGLAAASIEAAAKGLLEGALSQGGKDNITLILCKIMRTE